MDRYSIIANRMAPDPADSFFYGVRSSKLFCRPDCDAEEIPRRQSVVFFDSAKDAMDEGFRPCPACKPDLEVRIHDSVIASTVHIVNKTLGLDLNDPDESAQAQQSHNQQHQHAGMQILEGPPILEETEWRPRRASIASGHIAAAAAAVAQAAQDTSQSAIAAGRRRDRGDGDHMRLVDEACHHIAAAAASAAAAAAQDQSSEDRKRQSSSQAKGRSRGRSHSIGAEQHLGSSSSANGPAKLQRRKRRGGVMGFKELAVKAGLSPWHFHRVFRSVTGMTPKAYGEACWTAVTANPALTADLAAATVQNEHRPDVQLLLKDSDDAFSDTSSPIVRNASTASLFSDFGHYSPAPGHNFGYARTSGPEQTVPFFDPLTGPVYPAGLTTSAPGLSMSLTSMDPLSTATTTSNSAMSMDMFTAGGSMAIPATTSLADLSMSMLPTSAGDYGPYPARVGSSSSNSTINSMASAMNAPSTMSSSLSTMGPMSSNPMMAGGVTSSMMMMTPMETASSTPGPSSSTPSAWHDMLSSDMMGMLGVHSPCTSAMSTSGESTPIYTSTADLSSTVSAAGSNSQSRYGDPLHMATMGPLDGPLLVTDTPRLEPRAEDLDWVPARVN